MAETKLYLVRHGKTMFNTINRAQGWSDTPLTPEGKDVIQQLGIGLHDVSFEEAYSSDSGRAIQTAMIILQEHPQKQQIPFQIDDRIREWGFGSLDGGYNESLWGILARVLNVDGYDGIMSTVSYEALADAILTADTTGWAEPYEKIKARVWNGFEEMAAKREQAGGGNTLIVSHGYTIAFFLSLIDQQRPVQFDLENGSVTTITYNSGQFSIEKTNVLAYIQKGQIKQYH